jgi:hypothetical protein
MVFGVVMPANRRTEPSANAGSRPMSGESSHPGDCRGDLRLMRRTDADIIRGRTVATAVFRFALEVGMVPLTGTTDAGHMKADLDAFQFRLGPDEVEREDVLASRRGGTDTGRGSAPPRGGDGHSGQRARTAGRMGDGTC